MNNDLEQFSEERLKEIVAGNIPLYSWVKETQALARIALAVKQAKPVAWITWHQGCRAPDDCEDYLNAYTYKTEEKSVDGTDAFPVYTTPQPAHIYGFDPALAGSEATVITNYFTPDGWKLVPIEPNDYWAERYCELTNKDPDGEQSTFICDGVVTTTFREKSKREIAAMLAAAPLAATPKPESE